MMFDLLSSDGPVERPYFLFVHFVFSPVYLVHVCGRMKVGTDTT